MYSSLFWKDTFERLVATLAQVALGLLASDITSFANIPWEAWVTTLVVSGVAVVLKALAAGRTDNTVSPASFAPAAPDLPAVDHTEATPIAEAVRGLDHTGHDHVDGSRRV